MESYNKWIYRVTRGNTLGPFLTLIILIVVFQSINNTFLSLENIAVILRAMSYCGILAVGLTFCLIGGMLDISMGAIAGFASVVMSQLVVKHEWNGILSIVIAIVLSGLIGYVNGKVTTTFGVSSIIVTIGSMYVVRGIANVLSDGFIVYPLGGWLADFGSAKPFNISWTFFAMVVAFIVGELVLHQTVWGLCVKATGSDRESAWCNEVDVDRITIQTFVVLGVLAAIAGIFLSLRINSGLPTVGLGWELNAIAACAIGGVSLFGHDGSMINAFIGLLIVQVMSNGLVIIGVPAHFQPVAIGLVMIISVVLDMRRKLILERSSKQ